MGFNRPKCSMLLILLVVAAQAGCSRRTEPKNQTAETAAQRIPDQESWNSTLITTDMGRITAKIWYGHMRKFNDQDVYEFDQNIKVEIFNKKGRRTSWITADRGRLFEARKFMEAIGHVVAHSDSADITLFTERLQWDDKRKKIVSNDFVTLATAQDTLYGVGFESEADLTRWVIKNPRGVSSRPVDLNLEKQPQGKKKTRPGPPGKRE